MSFRNLVTAPVSLLTIATLAAGCGDNVVMEPVTGPISKFVTRDMSLPVDRTEGAQLGFDLDADGTVDNKLGEVIATLSTFGFDVNSEFQMALDAGRISLLHSVRADNMDTDDRVGWNVMFGDPTNPSRRPAFDGSDTYSVDPTSVPARPIIGTLSDGVFTTTEPGVFSLEIALFEGQAPVRFDLIGGTIEAKISAGGTTRGRLAGAVTKTQLDAQIIPAIAELMNQTRAKDAGCAMTPPMCRTDVQKITDLFDDNGDLVISADELRDNYIIKGFVAPDLDLIDDKRNIYSPTPASKGGMKDSISVGFSFSMVGSVFTDPAE